MVWKGPHGIWHGLTRTWRPWRRPSVAPRRHGCAPTAPPRTGPCREREREGGREGEREREACVCLAACVRAYICVRARMRAHVRPSVPHDGGLRWPVRIMAGRPGYPRCTVPFPRGRGRGEGQRTASVGVLLAVRTAVRAAECLQKGLLTSSKYSLYAGSGWVRGS
jgi:hypothetical protein